MSQLLDGMLDFFSELLPTGRQPRKTPDSLRHFHLGAIYFSLCFAADLLVAERNGLQLVDELELLFVRRDKVAKLAANFGLLFGIGGTAFFDIAKIDEIVEFIVAAFEQLSDLGNPQLNQSGPAD